MSSESNATSPLNLSLISEISELDGISSNPTVKSRAASSISDRQVRFTGEDCEVVDESQPRARAFPDAATFSASSNSVASSTVPTRDKTKKSVAEEHRLGESAPRKSPHIASMTTSKMMTQHDSGRFTAAPINLSSSSPSSPSHSQSSSSSASIVSAKFAPSNNNIEQHSGAELIQSRTGKTGCVISSSRLAAPQPNHTLTRLEREISRISARLEKSVVMATANEDLRHHPSSSHQSQQKGGRGLVVNTAALDLARRMMAKITIPPPQTQTGGQSERGQSERGQSDRITAQKAAHETTPPGQSDVEIAAVAEVEAESAQPCGTISGNIAPDERTFAADELAGLRVSAASVERAEAERADRLRKKLGADEAREEAARVRREQSARLNRPHPMRFFDAARDVFQFVHAGGQDGGGGGAIRGVGRVGGRGVRGGAAATRKFPKLRCSELDEFDVYDEMELELDAY